MSAPKDGANFCLRILFNLDEFLKYIIYEDIYVDDKTNETSLVKEIKGELILKFQEECDSYLYKKLNMEKIIDYKTNLRYQSTITDPIEFLFKVFDKLSELLPSSVQILSQILDWNSKFFSTGINISDKKLPLFETISSRIAYAKRDSTTFPKSDYIIMTLDCRSIWDIDNYLSQELLKPSNNDDIDLLMILLRNKKNSTSYMLLVKIENKWTLYESNTLFLSEISSNKKISLSNNYETYKMLIKVNKDKESE